MGRIVGREEPLAVIRAACIERRGSWVCGPRGVGVSAVLRAAADEARDRDLRVVHTVASALGESLHAARTLVGTDTSIARFGRQLAETGCDVAIIDDAHRIDDDSVEALRLAILNQGIVLIAGTTSSRIGPALAWLVSSGTLRRVELLALSPSDTAELVEAELGRPPDSELGRALHDDGGGLPGYLVATLDLAESTGAIVDRRGRLRRREALPVTAALSDRIRELSEPLSDPARAALEVLSIAGPIELSVALTLLDVEPLGELETNRLIDIAPPAAPIVRITPAAIARTVTENLGYLGRARVAGEIVARRPEVATELMTWWTALAGRPVPEGQLVAAARTWRERGDVGRAQSLAELAWSAGSAPAGIVLAEARSALGHRGEAAELLAATIGTADAKSDAALLATFELTTLRLWNLDDPSGARELAESGVLSTRGHAFEGIAAGALASVEAYTGNLSEAIDAATPWVDDRIAGELVCQVIGVAETLRGRPRHGADFAVRGLTAAERRVRGEEGVVGPDPEIHVNAVALALITAGDLDSAAKLLDDWSDQGIANRVHAAWLALSGARLALAAGDPARADRLARDAVYGFADLDNRPPLRWALAGRILAACGIGDADGARAARNELLALGSSAVSFLDVDIARSLAWCSWLDGDTDRGRAELTAAALAAEASGAHALAADAWHDVVRFGDAATARRAFERLSLDESRWSAPRLDLAAGVADRDIDRLARAADGFAEIGAALAAFESATAMAQAARERGDRGATRAATARCASLGAAVTGVQSPMLAATRRPELSPREDEVANLAAMGLTSRAIAERLEVSSRTVDNLLQRVYAKLGVSRRSELATIWPNESHATHAPRNG